MSLQPSTQLLPRESDFELLSGEDIRPENVECPECNRYGKWVHEGGENGDTRLEIPCYGCVKLCGFNWYGIPCNGHNEEGKELRNHEVVMKIIDEKYEECVTDGSIIPSYQTFTCMVVVFENVFAYLDVGARHHIREDLKEYSYAILNDWNQLGNWPVIQEGDNGHEIRFFRETYGHTILSDFNNEMIVGFESDSNSSRAIIENLSFEEDEEDEEDEDYNEKKKKLCSEGLEIVDGIKENDGKMNEGKYIELMNIFKKLYDI